MPYVADATDVAQPTDVGVAASTAPLEFRTLKEQIRDYLNGTDAIPGGIKFPAVQVPSANANTLDDYEEGTWTPEISGVAPAGSCTYAFRAGTYVKIGKMVFISCWVEWTGHTGVGGMVISGLPFPAADTNDLFPAIFLDMTFTSTHQPFIWLTGGVIDAMIPGSRFAATPIDANAGIITQGFYRATA